MRRDSRYHELLDANWEMIWVKEVDEKRMRGKGGGGTLAQCGEEMMHYGVTVITTSFCNYLKI